MDVSDEVTISKFQDLFNLHPLTETSNDGILSNEEIEKHILSLTNILDKNHGSEKALTREIEKRIEKFGALYDKPKPKILQIKASKNVQKLRSKFRSHK